MGNILSFNDKGEIEINAEILAELNKVRLLKANADKRYKELTSAILVELQRDYGDSINTIGDYKVVKKGGAFTLAFDEEKFKAEQPLEYAKYCKVVQENESISLTYGKREK